MRAKYVNPFTDFGFKKIFGEDASKPHLIDFLNSLLPQNSQIKDLAFKSNELLGEREYDRKSIFDIYCESTSGEKFIVELQKAKQIYFKDRTVYYSTFPIKEQADKGEWNYKLNAVFCIGILDFVFEDYEFEPEKKEVFHTIKLKDQHGRVFYDKLTFIYLETPNFNKQENELETRLDKWLYFIKNLEDFQSIPAIFKNEIVFESAFEKARLANLDEDQVISYERSMREFRDAKNTFDYAIETATNEGLAQGHAQGHAQGLAQGHAQGYQEGINAAKEIVKSATIETAKKLKLSGVDPNLIAISTGLSIDEIRLL